VFGDETCVSFDTQLEWCRLAASAAEQCSDAVMIRSCLSCLEQFKKTVSDDDVVFQIVCSCCCCLIFAFEDKFAAADTAFSDASAALAKISETHVSSLDLKYFVAYSGARMFQMRHSYASALQLYLSVQSIFSDSHQMTLATAALSLEMQVLLAEGSTAALNSKLDVLISKCSKFASGSAVSASLARSKAFLLERNQDLDKAEEHYCSTVISSDVSAFGAASEWLAWDQVCLGRLYMQRLQISLAESALIAAIKIYIKIRGDQNSRIALILFELASVYERYGSYTQAWEKACKSIKILDRVPREGHWSACEAYLGLGKFMLVIDNWYNSLEYLSLAAAGFSDLQGAAAFTALESAAFASFAEHLMICDAESLRKSRKRIFSVLSHMSSSTESDSASEQSSSRGAVRFAPSIAYAKWLSIACSCNIFSCNSIAKRYIVEAKKVCASFSSTVAATMDPLLIVAQVMHGRYSKASVLLSSFVPPALLSESNRKSAVKFGVEHTDLLHAGAMLHYAVCNHKIALDFLRASKLVLSHQTSDGVDWTQNSVKIFRIDAIECMICSETGASLKAFDSAKAQLDRLRLGKNHLLYHMLSAMQMQSDLWKGCFSPASKHVLLASREARALYKPSHFLSVRFCQLEAVAHIVSGSLSNALHCLSSCQSAMYSGWSPLHSTKPAVSRAANFFLRVARDAHAKLGFGHRELCTCFAIRTFAHSFSGQRAEAETFAALTQRCVGSVVNSMSAVREESKLNVFASVSQLFLSMLDLLSGKNSLSVFDSCSSCVDTMLACGWTSDNFWVGLGRFFSSLAAMNYGNIVKAREIASVMFDKLTNSSQSACMLSSSLYTITFAFSGASLSEADIIAQLKPFLHPSLHQPPQDDADALWAYPFMTAAGAVALWASCYTESARRYIEATNRFLQNSGLHGHPVCLLALPISMLLSPDSSVESVFEVSGLIYDATYILTPRSMRSALGPLGISL
jgi:tetratricopeptide (TPR) repeat protein